ncbi:MAG: type II secretion system F family protein [Acidobacteria bacterium]|nr:type II secretion system F family protein [Acidobacteriota bacterium]
MAAPGRLAGAEQGRALQQCALLLEAGLPLVSALDLRASLDVRPSTRELWHQLARAVESGTPLSAAMRRLGDAVDPFVAGMVDAGEQSGEMPAMLERAGATLIQRADTGQAVRRALSYPMTVLSVAALVMLGLTWRVVPLFAELFSGLGVPLPWPTRALLEASALLGRWGLMAVLGCAVLGLWWWQWRRQGRGRRAWRALLGRLPFSGRVLRGASVTGACRMLAMLLRAGLPLTDALATTALCADEPEARLALLRMRRAVLRGDGLRAALERDRWWPPLVIECASVGETTGRLDTMLLNAAETCERELRHDLATALTLIEPAVMVLVGGVVAAMVLSLYLPLFSLMQTLGR